MSAYSTPRPTFRVRCVPSRSSSSVRGSRVSCGGATGNTNTSATATVADPSRRPPNPVASTRTRDRVSAPALGRNLQLQPSRLPVDDIDAGPRHRRRLDGHGCGSCCRPDTQRHLFALEAAQQLRFRCQRDGRRSALPAHRAQYAEQRRREGDQLPTGSEHRHRQRDNGGGGYRAGQRRRPPTQFDVTAADIGHGDPPARGTGRRCNSSSTTSVLRTCRTHISGRRAIRCAMAATASDFTSSGST